MIKRTYKVDLISQNDNFEYKELQKNLLNSLNMIVYGLVQNKTITLEKNPENLGIIVNLK